MYIDPAPLFATSIIPYLIFLYCLEKTSVPKVSILGFKLTLLFVLITIIAAIMARLFWDKDLVEIDALHGGAEAFLTLGNAILLSGLVESKRS